jgi:2-keto-4-pentenoate hydratase/2-oxohepta-3-ene-1,7-dioic acid hydratase in catechol pathway
MRLASYRENGVKRAGIVAGQRIHPLPGDLDARAAIALGLDGLLEAGGAAIASGEGAMLDAVTLLPPLRPATIRDFVAFEEHVAGVRRSVDGRDGIPDAWYDAPTFYFANPYTVIGPGDPVPFPAACRTRDFELEVAAVLGSGGGDLSLDGARRAIVGYTILNDWSARDIQAREMGVGLGPAKGKDFATSLGPWLVTADELEPYRDGDGFLALSCVAAVNGVEVGRDSLSHMGWTFEAMVAYASRDSRVGAGDVFGSGTVGNGGCLAELCGRYGDAAPPPLHPGDLVTLTVEGIGSLTNRITVADPAPPVPEFRRSPIPGNRRNTVPGFRRNTAPGSRRNTEERDV